MRIVQTPARFYPYAGGVESYVYNLSRSLVELGHDVSVICANEPESPKEETINGVKVKRLSYIGKIANTNITPKLPSELWKAEFDIIHTHLPTPWSADWSAVVSRFKNKPLLLTYHNDIVGFEGADYVARLYNKTMLRLVLRRAKSVIVTNKKQLKFSPFLKSYAEKIEVIPPGVDTKKFRPAKIEKEENSLFFLSVLDRYHKYKGLDYLLNALKIVKNEVRNVKLTVGGSGELLEHYKEMADSLGLRNNIEFVGYIPEESIPYYYGKSQLFVLPSIAPAQEGFGIVLLEAMACGLPVVATDVVGLAEKIKKENAGVIAQSKDADSLADAIMTALKNKKLGRSARKLAERYDWRRITEAISRVYFSILS